MRSTFIHGWGVLRCHFISKFPSNWMRGEGRSMRKCWISYFNCSKLILGDWTVIRYRNVFAKERISLLLWFMNYYSVIQVWIVHLQLVYRISRRRISSSIPTSHKLRGVPSIGPCYPIRINIYPMNMAALPRGRTSWSKCILIQQNKWSVAFMLVWKNSTQWLRWRVQIINWNVITRIWSRWPNTIVLWNCLMSFRKYGIWNIFWVSRGRSSRIIHLFGFPEFQGWQETQNQRK